MNYKAHRVGGICLGLTASMILTKNHQENLLPIFYTLTAGSAVGSLIPDIDQPESYIGQITKPLSTLIYKIFGHRGGFHSPLLIALFIFSFFCLKGLLTTNCFIILLTLFGISTFSIISDHKKLFIPWVFLNVYILINVYINVNFYDWYFLLITGLSIGIISHLLIDTLTITGIPVFWPLSKKKFHLAKLKTNKHELITKILFILMTFCVFMKLYIYI